MRHCGNKTGRGIRATFGADKGVGAGLIDTVRLVATDVHGGVFGNCGHYMPEEAPRAVAERIIGFLDG